MRSRAAEAPVPADLDARFQRALSLNEQGQFADAAIICRELLKSTPGHIEAGLLLAEVASRTGELEESILLYTRVIELDPGRATPYYKRGNCLKDRAQLEAALLDYDKAIALDSRYANALCNRGVVLGRLGRLREALESYQQALVYNPTDALAYFNCGSVLRELHKPLEALASYDRAIAVKPDYVECHYNRGMLLVETRQWDAALLSLDLAIAIKPDFAEAYFSRGNVLLELKRNPAALKSFDSAIALKPDNPDAFHNRANILFSLRQFTAAIASFDRVIDLRPTLVDAYIGRGLCLQNLRKFEAAIASYDNALTLNADQRYLLGLRRHAKMQICDWGGFESDLERLAEGLNAHRPISAPHAMLALVDSPRLHRLAAEAWVREECPANDALGAIPARQRGERIRIGYFSADFRDHAVSLLSAQLFETHDRARFEVIAFAFGPKVSDAIRARMEVAFDRFIDVSALSDIEVAATARDMGLDIAVDLGGFTEDARTKVFALRAAPIQVNYLGYPGTMGATYMDYMIGDLTVVPGALQHRYAEKIVYLPHSYLPNDSTRAISDTRYTRQELGLPSTGLIFCCFNNSYKINPGVFDSWMRILIRVESSVLWLSRNNPVAERNLREQASRAGVDPGRLIFADRVFSQPKHLARYRNADLFLDTFPYNAHATAIDALWSGLPVLTRSGNSFASRVAASLLTAIGLPELITSTAEQYEEVAVQLAEDPALLLQIKEKLSRNRREAALFDTVLLSRHLEAAYSEMLHRYDAGLAPEHIFVSRLRTTAGP